MIKVYDKLLASGEVNDIEVEILDEYRKQKKLHRLFQFPEFIENLSKHNLEKFIADCEESNSYIGVNYVKVDDGLRYYITLTNKEWPNVEIDSNKVEFFSTYLDIEEMKKVFNDDISKIVLNLLTYDENPYVTKLMESSRNFYDCSNYVDEFVIKCKDETSKMYYIVNDKIYYKTELVTIPDCFCVKIDIKNVHEPQWKTVLIKDTIKFNDKEHFYIKNPGTVEGAICDLIVFEKPTMVNINE